MKHFNASEFSENIKYADPQLLENLDALRAFLKLPVYPSTAKGALARFDPESAKSQHYAVNRLSTAIDFFTDGEPFDTFTKILHSGLFNRVGVYFDTHYRNQPEIMFHGDLKHEKLLWYRINKKYTYSTHPMFYRKLFKNFFLRLKS